MSTLTSITNLYSMNILGSMGKAQSNLGTAIQRLSSGEAVSSAFDSPSGFVVSEKMRSYIADLKSASNNAQNGISYLQTAEGATNEITSMLQRMRELSVEASNGIYTSSDRQELQKEMGQLKAEIDRISDSTEFNTKKLLSGETTGTWNSGTNRISALITGPVADGNYDISLGVTPGKNQVDTSQILTIKDGKLGAQVNNGGSSNITIVRDPRNVSVTGGDYEVTVADRITGGDTANIVSSYKQNGNIFATAPVGTAISTNQSGYMEIEFIESSDTANLAGTRFRMRFISAETGTEGQWVEFASGVNDSLSGTYTANGMNVSFQIPITTSASSTVSEGDKLLFAVSDNKDMATADRLLASGGGTVQITQDGVAGPFVTYGKNALTKADNKDGVEDTNDVTIYTVEMDPKTGEIKKGSFALGFKENTSAGATLSGTATIEVRGGGEPATATTKLADIANFIDADGNDLLSSPQELNLFGNSNNASLYIDKNDTMTSLLDKLMKAISNDLQMGSGDVSVDRRIAEYVNNAGGNGFKAVPGTLVLQSGITGDAGKISFGGSQKLLDAIGFQTVQKAENNITEVTIKNNRTGEIAGVGTTSDGKVKNIIEGLDVAFDSRASVEARWNPTTGMIEFLKSERLENFNMNLHIVDARTKVQIGARKGENLDVSIPQIDTKSLGIENTNLSTQEDAQRAITQVDGALAKVTSVRSEMGSKVNRLERAISNIATTVVNVTESDSRIRDADVAVETSNMTMAQLMYQTNIAMMAQANQIPGMALSLITQR